MTKTIIIYIYRHLEEKDPTELIISCASDYQQKRGLTLADRRLVSKPHGKPDFADPQLFFNVSHSKDLWVCAVSTSPVGVDIEKVRDCQKDMVARRFFHPDEYKHLQQSDFRDFFPLWCARESYVKYTGQGIDDEFKKLCLIKDDQITNAYRGAYLYPLVIADGYAGYLCSAIARAVILQVPGADR